MGSSLAVSPNQAPYFLFEPMEGVRLWRSREGHCRGGCVGVEVVPWVDVIRAERGGALGG
jgi:hypothetical protein